MDDLDRALIAQLQADARQSMVTLSRKLRVARTTVQSPLRWSDNPDWKLDFSNISQLSEEEIAQRKRDFDKVKEVAASRRVEDGLKVDAAE